MRVLILSRLYFYVAAFLALAHLLAGMWIGYQFRPDEPQAESIAPAPAERQADGSVVAPRVVAPARTEKPPHQLPRRAVEERRMSVKVQPHAPTCPPLLLDLSLVQLDGGRRIVASSPDGEIIDSLDMPLEAALLPPPVRSWGAGVSFDPRTDRSGVWLDRDFGRVRIGADLRQDRDGALTPAVRIGWRF